MDKLSFSIIIPVYNGSNFLKEAIDSALLQTYRNFEIIVVDDGSNDEGKTKKIISSYGKKVRAFYKDNGGVASALNLGIINARGEYLAWLSHDDLFKPWCLQVYANYIRHAKYNVYYGNYDLIDKNSHIYNEINFRSKYTDKQLSYSVFPVLCGCVNGCACVIHKSEYERCGLFNESLRITQDNDMWFRIFRDQRVGFIGEILSSKRYHPEQDSAIKYVYEDEDIFLYKSIASLSEIECAEFLGNMYHFFSFFEKRVNDGKHPFTWRYCMELKKRSKEDKTYEHLTQKELCVMLAKSNEVYECIENQYEELQKKYISLLMGR